MSTANRELTYVQALCEAQYQALANDPTVFVAGLDVDDHKGIQGTTQGLVDAFGANRVFTTPLSEDAMTGIMIGAAMSGLKPIHIHIRMDFLLLCMNQLVNIAAKAHDMYAGAVHVPLTIRSIIGKSWGQGAQHSQGLHSLLMHIPGLKVVAPSNAYDAKGLLLAAINDPNPVIIVEHRLLYQTIAVVPEIPYQLNIGQAKIARQGQHITLVAVSYMVIECLRAATLLAELGIEVTVIDLVSLSPLDLSLIHTSVAQTKHLLVVDNAWLTCGTSSEIISQVCEQASDRVSVSRLGFAATTCPTAPNLEQLFYPNIETIIHRVLQLVNDPQANTFALSTAQRTSIEELTFKGPF